MYKEKFEKLSSFSNVLLGENVLKLLEYLKSEVEELQIFSEPSNRIFGDWVIPREWKNLGGFLKSLDGSIFIDLSDHPLRLMQYSNSFDGYLNKTELLGHIYIDDFNPDGLPYITNYYGDSFGICLTKSEFELIQTYNGEFQLYINTNFIDGNLYYAECVLKGSSDKEILISSYICHPYMANNELSGPILLIELIKFLRTVSRRYTYRFVLVPETLGAIVYINKNLTQLKNKIEFGLNLTCIGDDRAYSMVSTPNGNTKIDKIIELSLIDKNSPHKYTWLERGSDERQYNAPGVELNVVTICRSKFGKFREYHSSNDCFGKTVTEDGMQQSLIWLKEILWLIENNFSCYSTSVGEPFMSRHKLYPETSIKGRRKNHDIMNFLSLCNGNSLLEIGIKMNIGIKEIKTIFELLKSNDLIRIKFN